MYDLLKYRSWALKKPWLSPMTGTEIYRQALSIGYFLSFAWISQRLPLFDEQNLEFQTLLSCFDCNSQGIHLFIGKSELKIEVVRRIYRGARLGRLRRDITRALNLVVSWKF